MSLITRWHPGREDRSRGAVLVEFALVLPVLVVFVLGIVEYGNLWRQVGTLERATQQGARAVSAQANGRYADFEGLRSIDAVTRGMSGVTIDRVIIYRATAADGQVPAACLAGSVANTCNTYTGPQVQTVSPVGFPSPSLTNPSCGGGSWDIAWCPTTRPRSDINPVRVGVHITATYTPVTGILPGPTATVERFAVFQIEPCAQGQSEC
jgi:hypothetical protein